MNITVIIVAYHGDKWLPECLRTLVTSETDRLHLVLVDNSGNTIIKDLNLSPFQAEVISTPRPMGFAEANNHALINASHLNEIILFLNQDTVSASGWLSGSIGCLEVNPGIAAITPLTKNYDRTGWEPYFLKCAQKSVDFQNDLELDGGFNGFYETPVIPAAAMLVRSAVLEQTGPFDPVYGSYYEDYDLCRRISAAGYGLGVCAEGEIGHYSGSATKTKADENRRARWVTRNQVIYQLRGANGNRLIAFLNYLVTKFPRNLARSLLRRKSAKPLIPFIQAHWSLLLLVPRLVSRRYDEKKWREYLGEIGWPPARM